MVKVKYPKKNY